MRYVTKRILLAFTAASITVPSIAGESLDRFGRLLGVGWSDGYHACGADSYYVGENLPPISYATSRSLFSAKPRHNFASYASITATQCDAYHGDQGQAVWLTDELSVGTDIFQTPTLTPVDDSPFSKGAVERLPTPAADPLPPTPTRRKNVD